MHIGDLSLGKRQLVLKPELTAARERLAELQGEGAPISKVYLLVKAVSGAVIWAKLRTWLRKKLQSPKNCLISFTFEGGGA